jgi:hypothetical protein
LVQWFDVPEEEKPAREDTATDLTAQAETEASQKK